MILGYLTVARLASAVIAQEWRLRAAQIHGSRNGQVLDFGGHRDRDGVDALTDEV